MSNVGETAPEFTLKDQDQKEVKLSDFKGKKVLLAFFPFAFSPVCSVEFGCFDKDTQEFQKKGINVLGISVDSHWTQKAFAEKHGLTIPLLSDFGKETVKAYGLLRKEGFSERAYVVIDEKGKIIYNHVMDTPGKRLENNELLKIVR